MGLAYHRKKWKRHLFKLKWISLKDNLYSHQETRTWALSKLADYVGLLLTLISIVPLVLMHQTLLLTPVIFFSVKYLVMLVGKHSLPAFPTIGPDGS